MRPLCLTTSWTANFAPLGTMCAASLRRYAEAWNHDVHVEHECGDTGNRPPAWRRLLLVPELFDRGHEFVLWLDADAMFVRLDADVTALMRPGDDICMVRLDVTFHPRPVPNTGVMLLRNSAWTRGFLRRAWDRTAFVHHHWWENAAFISLMGYESMLDASAEDAPDEEVLSHVRFVGDEWNHSPIVGRAKDPIVRHYGGMPFEERVAGMSRDFVT